VEDGEAHFSFYSYSQETFEDSCILICILKKQAWLYRVPSSLVNEQVFLLPALLKDYSTLKLFFVILLKSTKYVNKHDLTLFLSVQTKRISFEFKLGTSIWQSAQMYLSETAKQYFILSPLLAHSPIFSSGLDQHSFEVN